MSKHKNCIKCGKPKRRGIECPFCGVIYLKAEDALERKRQIERQEKRKAAGEKRGNAKQPAKKPGKAKRFLAAFGIVIILLGAGGWWAVRNHVTPVSDWITLAAGHVKALLPGGNNAATAELTRDQKIIKALFAKNSESKFPQELLDQQTEELQRTILALSAEEKQPLAQQALILLEQGETGPAEQFFQNLLDRKKAEGQAAQKEAAGAARSLGSLLFFDDSWKALQLYELATGLDSANSGGWCQLGHLLLHAGELNKADSAYQNALRLDQNDQNGRMRNTLAAAYSRLGAASRDLGDLPGAIGMYTKSADIYEGLAKRAELSENYYKIGELYRTLEQFDSAEEMFHKSLEIDQTIGNKTGMASNYSGLGASLQNHGEPDKAITMFNKSLEINRSLDDKAGIQSNYSNLGSAYLDLGDLDRATEMLNKSLELSQSLNNEIGLAIDYGYLGSISIERKDLDNAFDLLNKALTISQKLGNQRVMAYQYRNIGRVHQARGNREMAAAMYNNALLLFQEIGATSMVEDVQKLLDKLGETKGS